MCHFHEENTSSFDLNLPFRLLQNCYSLPFVSEQHNQGKVAKLQKDHECLMSVKYDRMFEVFNLFQINDNSLNVRLGLPSRRLLEPSP